MANDNVDVDDSFTMGQNIVDKMAGQPVLAIHSNERTNSTLGDASAVKVALDKSTDPALLFQRLLVVSRTFEDVIDYNQYADVRKGRQNSC